ncbi:MAG TPA: hypothetical protein DIT89_06540, partial [Planctomycetaceae bacterium]|nr:hypothetical protein [Planctomycetaceae bacterium]
MDGAEQECSGYIFVLGIRNARATFWRTAGASPSQGIFGGLERGGRHGLKPMLRTPSTSSVTA